MNPRFGRLRALADACDPSAAAEARAEIASKDEGVLAIASALAAAYPALRGLVRTRPDALEELAREGWSVPRKRKDQVRRLLAACEATTGTYDLARVRRGLRRASNKARLRIALRELEPENEIDVTAREWSDLAEAQLEVALLEARAQVEERFGKVVDDRGERNGFCVIGLGKLGGLELNAGSDIDLMFVHGADEGFASRTDASDPDALRPFDAFTKIARRLVPTLDEHDDDGFCARVDLRLRPEGASGPLTNSIASAIGYYEAFGRGWERAALLRARAVAGDLAVGQALLAELSPFVYRRAVDPQIVGEMIEMVQRSRAELSDAPLRDLKLGPGGIREAEFFVQSLQLVWGGKDPGVRATNTLEALRRLRARGYVSDREARHIEAGYLLLRRAEHRVQIATGVQTHQLPEGGVELERLARSLGYRHDAALLEALDTARSRIAERFASLAPGRVTAADERVQQVLRTLAAADSGESTPPTDDLALALLALGRRPDAPLGGRTREKHPRFVTGLVAAILDAADPELAAGIVRSFFERLSPPSVETYVRALAADERALSRFVGLSGASAYLGTSLVGHPELADLMLFAARTGHVDEQRGARMLAEEIARLPHEDRQDPEIFVGAMRRAKSALELDVGLRDLAGEIDLRTASRALSIMADASLDAATGFALEEMARRRGLSGSLRGLAVLALGKLGGREIGYGSDLDVLFVYDPNIAAQHGLDPLDAGEVYARIAQRIIRLVGAPHEAGPGYELDARLRPSGEQGHLVVSLEAFRAYHLGRDGAPAKAADWERQTLLRLRPAAGDLRLGHLVAEIAEEAAYERGASNWDELVRIRERMERELARERPGRYDPKLGRGGLVDVELAVQWMLMRHGKDRALRTPETLGAIDALEARGHLSSAQATTLRDGYRFLRRLEQRARVLHGGKSVLLEEGAPGLKALARSMGHRDGPAEKAADKLLATYRAVTTDVRTLFASGDLAL
ncbi:MAG: bifunctional [glutamate--ammonia ligase]-adenylyl-L-tyrosine phosphorylase/[glutamate--ammonia-ligase] adenylyltransferase [Myxococcales bacterium]|nr:bifunctional [glutamate--ammonia ligase]-adenylyl-L-tyrosine phosphorylase/[glutamate--ammonia-ligase] adenylyltransferase [Myxococcales bacterium]